MRDSGGEIQTYRQADRQKKREEREREGGGLGWLDRRITQNDQNTIPHFLQKAAEGLCLKSELASLSSSTV